MRSAVLCAALTLLWSAAGAAPARDKAVEPTNSGRVAGQVYDATTGTPLAGVSVSVRQNGAYADRGAAVSFTDASGRYALQAMLGRRSSNLDLGRLLNSGWVGLLIGGANNETKRIDVKRMDIRVQKEGYAPFEGVVPCSRVDARKFAVQMSPILLAPLASGQLSTVAEGWGAVRLVDVQVEPAVAHAGDKVQVTASVQAPRPINPRDMKLTMVSTVWGRKGLSNPVEKDGLLVFMGSFNAPKPKKAVVDQIAVRIDSSPYDLSQGRSSRAALVQVVTTPAEEQTAQKRLEAFRREQSGDNVAAATALKEVAAQPDVTVWDLDRLADLCEAVHDEPGAVDALKRAVGMYPEKTRLSKMGRYANALVATGQSSQVITEMVPMVEKIRENDRPSQVPLGLMLAIGNAYLQEGRLDRADDVNNQLLKWDTPGVYPAVGRFQNALRLAQAQARVKEDSTSAGAHADLGRALMDQERWEEAVTELQASVRIDPNDTAVQRDLAYASVHLRPDPARASADLEESIAAAESRVELRNGNKVSKTKDFFAWHTLGMLLYQRLCQQEQAGDAAAAETRERCVAALMEGLKCARTGADVSDGTFVPFVGYATPSVVAVSGFAYPEADSDFVMLESLRALEARPDDYMAHLNLGLALLDLHQPELAAAPIQQALATRPDLPDGTFARALVALDSGRRDDAVELLREVLKRNPRHPRANLVLARIYTEDGNMPGAAACLAAHAAVYGAGDPVHGQVADGDDAPPHQLAAASREMPHDLQ